MSRAYEELTRSGSITGEIGRGTFVRAARGEAAVEVGPPYHRITRGEKVIDCSMLTPVLGALHATALRQTLAAIADEALPASLFSFRPREALGPHIEAALGWLDRCGVRARPEQVIPTNGATGAMTIALMTAAAPGDLVVSEALGHHTLGGLTRALSLRLSGLPLDAEGVKPDAFANICAARRVRVLFAMPGGLGAAASVMSRRAAAATSWPLPADMTC